MTQITQWCDHSPRARHPVIQSRPQEASLQTKLVKVMEFQLSYFKVQKDDFVKVLHSMCQQIWKNHQWSQTWKMSAFIPTPNKDIAFHCQRMFKLLHNCTHFTHQQSNAQNSPSQASTVHELRTSRCSSYIQKRQRNQRLNCQHLLNHRKSNRIPEKHLLLLH